jgi:intein-encoded DNA endonuclease-like protein
VPIYKKINKDFFKKWSRETAYVLGFFAADGNMIKTRRKTHFISFDSSDENILNIIRAVMKSEHVISKRTSETGTWYRLQIGSKEMFEDIERLGLRPNKSRRMELPNIPYHFFGDFVRGYFDGDGNVWVGLTHKNTSHPLQVIRTAFTSASQNFLKSLHAKLKTQKIIGGSIGVVKDKQCYRLKLATSDTLKLYTIMYNDPHKLYLKRKRLVFEKFSNMRL